MKRRAFFGFLGGAAAAGPKLATGLASEVARGAGISPTPGYDVGQAIGSSETWKTERIARLRKVISGKDPDAKRRRIMNRLYAAESAERFRLDSLRSVSATHKMQMFIDGNASRNERIRRQEAQFDLAELLREKLSI